MKPLINGQIPPPPANAWGAFFEWVDGEVAAGRETPESAREILECASRLDMDAQARRYGGEEGEPTPEQIRMSPCPFCEGPPCIDGFDFVTGESLPDDHPHDIEHGQDYSAHVWCHDCGARGPNIESLTLSTFEHLYDLSLMDVMRIAAQRWNDRNAKARDCYDAGEKNGLNMFPRSNP
jgi:hypothetical protein